VPDSRPRKFATRLQRRPYLEASLFFCRVRAPHPRRISHQRLFRRPIVRACNAPCDAENESAKGRTIAQVRQILVERQGDFVDVIVHIPFTESRRGKRFACVSTPTANARLSARTWRYFEGR